MCDKAVDTHPFTITFVPECYKTQEMCYKTIHRCFFVFDSFPDHYKTQEICDIFVSLYPFLIVYFPDKYKTQRMCDEAVDSLTVLKLIPNWFATSKMIKKFHNVLFADDGLLFLY